MQKIRIAIGILFIFNILFCINQPFINFAHAENSAYAQNNESENSEANNSVVEDSNSGTKKPKKTKQVAKDAATDALNSIIDETINAIGEGVTQSIRNPNTPVQTHGTESQLNEGRRQKPSRW